MRELIDRGSRSIEQKNWQQAIQDMNELERIKSCPRGPDRKEQAFGIALEGGIRTIEARLHVAARYDAAAMATEYQRLYQAILGRGART